MNLSMFESNSNYNAIIAATSGAGKTVLVNEIISNVLIRGGQCWTLDIGEGYKKQQIMYFGDVNRRKLVVIDEAWNLMRDTQGVALFIEHGFRRFRRFNGSNLMAAQRIEDFYETPAGKAALDNSTTQFLLKQEMTTINSLY